MEKKHHNIVDSVHSRDYPEMNPIPDSSFWELFETLFLKFSVFWTKRRKSLGLSQTASRTIGDARTPLSSLSTFRFFLSTMVENQGFRNKVSKVLLDFPENKEKITDSQ